MRAGKVIAVMLLLAMVAGMAVAQEPPRPKPDDPNAAYRLEYVIAEVEGGKRVNTRTYVLLADEGGMGNMHMGMKVPVQAEKGPIYLDVGLRIDSRVRPRDNGAVWLSTRFELSSLVEQSQTVNGALPLRSIEYSTSTLVTVGKSTVIAAGDDLNSQKKFELSVTVTKLR
jgi:hypothetical protein